MTQLSLEILKNFLNNPAHHIHGRVADYGGSRKVGKNVVKTMLKKGGIEDYTALDLDSGVNLLKPIKKKKFDVGICMDLLEHVSNPFLVAENITDSLNKGAFLFVTAPFAWELHFHPKDYWRFTPQGLQELFKKMETVIIFLIRDDAPDEDLERQRVVGVFRKK